MLICPECQSRNPDNNKFCQHCGSSLSQTNCLGCGAEISSFVKECPHCETANLPKLIAFILSDPLLREPELVATLGENVGSDLAMSSKSSKASTQAANYLNREQRYSLNLETKQTQKIDVAEDAKQTVVRTQAWDLFPLQETALSLLEKEQQQLLQDLKSQLNDSYLSICKDLNEMGLPTIALPYLMLESYSPVIPSLYDAWHNESSSAVLLSDRSEWQLLTELWQDEAVPWEQLLWSLNEMLKYWHPLEQVGCTSTLLAKDNLRIDEDGAFGIVELHLDLQGKTPSLQDLVTCWDSWLQDLGDRYQPELAEILQQVIAGKITSVTDLQANLYSLVDPEESSSSNELIQDRDTEDTEDTGEITEWLEEEPDRFEFADNGVDSLFEADEAAEDIPTTTVAMQIASVTEASCTDIGSQRDHNEDFFGSRTTLMREENPSSTSVSVKGLYLVCDGMGGHSSGEVASAMAAETLQSYFYTYWQDSFPSEETIADGIYLANKAIYQTNIDNDRSGSGMMGTTLVMALLQDTQLVIAHVGDSRIYRITRTNGLEQLTQDHEVGQREINRGVEPEIAYGRPDAYQLTQALGPRESKYIRPEVKCIDVREDCLLLLCSDGMSDNDLIEKHWQIYLEPLLSSSADLQSGLFKLIDFADRYNGHDNITGILLRIKLQPNFETSIN